MSHTHAGANVNSQLQDKPGSDLIQPYIDHLTGQIGAAILEAREALAPAWVTLRDRPLCRSRRTATSGTRRPAASPSASTPARPPTTRSSSRGSPVRTASPARRSSTTPATRRRWRGRTGCSRPTTSARRARSWRTRSAPPRSSCRAPPASSRRATTTSATRAVADRNGRQLGYAAAAAVEGLPPPGTKFVYTRDPGVGRQPRHLGVRAVRPGATRPPSSWQRASPPSSFDARRTSASSRPPPARHPTRCRSRRKRFAGGSSTRRSATARPTRCRSGRGGSARPCSSRSRTSRTPCSRSTYGAGSTERRSSSSASPTGRWATSPREDTYGSGLYQEQQSPFAPGCLEQTIEVAARELYEVRQ